jgi:RNA binding exosome subunit
MDKKDLRSIQRSLDLRVNTSCVFFLRIDKQGAYLGKLRLADSTDVIRVMIHFKDSPRCKQNDAILLIEEYLQNAED